MVGSLRWAVRVIWTDTLNSPLCLAALAVPVANRDLFQIDAVCMVVSIATIASEKSLLVVILATDETRLVFYFFVVVFYEHRRIDFCNLSPVADRIGGNYGPYVRSLSARSSTACYPEIEHLPPAFVLSSTLLKFCRQIGQLLARSTQGFKHSLCRLCPQGNR